MASVTLVGVRKIYQEGPRTRMAVDGVDLAVADGEFVVLVGPSGCGKSTTLRMIAGLESVTAGTLRIGDRVVNDVPPKDRNIAMVFQNYALYPHMTAYENMAFGLKLRGLAPADIDARVREAAGLLGIAGLLERRPRHLNGGEVQQIDTPLETYRRPRNTFVSGFIGSPAMNLLPGAIVRDGGLKFRVDDAAFALGLPPAWERALAAREGRRVILGIRPEDVRPATGAGTAAAVPVRLDLVEPLGQELLVCAHSGAHEVMARLAPSSQVEPGQEITLSFDPDALHFFDAETRERLPLPAP